MPPEVYDPEIAEEILVRMSGGESLRTICADDGYPCRRTVTRWAVRDTQGFGARYATARRAGVEARIEDANEIAAETPTYTDEAGVIRIDAAGIQRNRLRCDQAKWEASHLLRGGLKPSAPLDYGDKIQTEVSGPDGGTIQSEHRIVFVDAPKAP
jgi:hypothetical protein